MRFQFLAIFAGIHSLSAQPLPFPVYKPTDSQPKEAAEALKPEIHESVEALIAQLKAPKDAGFIETIAAVGNTKWRVQNVTIITPEVVAVNFTEGHIEVIAILVRNPKESRWEVKAEIGGKLRERIFSDPPTVS